jgi:flagellar motility protein MotE (MotC chaperone)
MKPAVKYALMGGGSLVLLFGSFVTFAALSGQPMHKIAILKNFVKAPESPMDGGSKGGDKPLPPDATAKNGGSETQPDPSKIPAVKDKQALEASVGVLGAFSLPTGFSADELTDLKRELRNASKGAKERLAKIEQRERELDDRERDLDQRYVELSEIRKQLEAKELEIGASEAEIKRDASARDEREKAGWKTLAKFFEEGEPADMAKNLVSYGPGEAAKILHSLDDERATAIVNALPADKYHEYLEAFRLLTVKDGAKKQP